MRCWRAARVPSLCSACPAPFICLVFRISPRHEFTPCIGLFHRDIPNGRQGRLTSETDPGLLVYARQPHPQRCKAFLSGGLGAHKGACRFPALPEYGETGRGLPASFQPAPVLRAALPVVRAKGLFGDLERFPAHEPDEPFRWAHGASVASGAGVFSHAFGKQGLALGVHDIVHKDERGASDFGYPRADMDQIVISGGPPVAALGFAYGQHDAEAFHLRVTHAHLADVLAA